MRAWFTKHPSVRVSLPALLLGGLILVLYGSFLVHRINLTVSDLGRHLQNGREALAHRAIHAANFYSYTHPDEPVVNHHWGSGAVLFLAWKAGGFAGVHVLFTAVGLATLALFFLAAARAAGPGPAALIAVLAIPLLAERTEIRPEAVSYLFAAVFFLLLMRFEKIHDWRWLAVLPFLQAIWVNMHIYFFLGPVLIAIFLMAGILVRPGDRKRVAALAYAALASAAASLLNPFFLKGAMAPFRIFENYGYRVAENQPVWFVETLLQNPNFTIFKILFLILTLSFAAGLWFVGVRGRAAGAPAFAPFALVGLMVSAMAWMATRNFALFGFFFIPLVATNLSACCGPWLARRRRETEIGATILVSLLIVPALFGQWQRYFPYWKEPGLGLERGNGDAAAFFLARKLRGPIFNNYDIGGYLIWHLFPQEKVFVDNRPEAYPAAFFRDTYIPMQEQDDAWQQALRQWQFNTIFFSHRDMTPWAQQFLMARVQDREWAPVYADRYAIIFLRRNEDNKETIDRFEIPQSAFQVVKR